LPPPPHARPDRVREPCHPLKLPSKEDEDY
jgi:hypothetical protein